MKRYFWGLLFLATIQANSIVDLDDKSFYKSISSGYAVVDFYASWCPPCSKMSKVLDAIVDKIPATVFRINIDDNRILVDRYGIKRIPLLIIFKNGQELKRFSGSADKDALLRFIRSYID